MPINQCVGEAGIPLLGKTTSVYPELDFLTLSLVFSVTGMFIFVELVLVGLLLLINAAFAIRFADTTPESEAEAGMAAPSTLPVEIFRNTEFALTTMPSDLALLAKF